jgi:ubiquinone biosynthesis protein COQ9
MVRVKFGENFIIPEPTDINDHVESHIWLPLKEAQEVARHLINMNAIFTYMYEDDEQVEIIAFDDDLDKILIMDVEVRQ